MIGKRLVAIVFLASALSLGAPASADLSLDAWAAAKAVSAKVGKPYQEAQKLAQQSKFREALNKINEADKISGKSAYEQFVINDMKGFLYTRLGDYASAARAYEAVIASGQLSGEDLAVRQRAVISLYYQVGHSAFTRGDYATAIANVNKSIELRGRADEDSLQLLMAAQYKGGDMKGYSKTLERLVRAYPKPEYWSDLLASVKRKPGLSEKQSLDIYRLQLAAGALVKPSDYTQMAELALLNGFPGDAKAVLEKGFKSGVLGNGPQADRQKKLLEMARKQSADDLRALAQVESAAKAAATGQKDVKIAEAYASYGQYDKAIAAFERGLAKGGLENPEEAKLNLAWAYLLANQKEKARKTFASINGKDGTAEIARLWLLHLS